MKYLKILSLVFISAIFFTGCVDQEFDSPPFTENGDDPQIDESKIKSMSDVKALSGSGDITEIIDDIYVKGIVISDDKSGNFYKVLYPSYKIYYLRSC